MRAHSLIPIPVIAALAALVLILLPGPESQPNPQSSRYAPALRQACANCGTVELVREVERRRDAAAGAAPEGRIAESVLGYRMGGGGGEGFVVLLGAMAGRLPTAGAGRFHEVDVRFEDGSVRTFRYSGEPAWRLGDRVRVIQGRIIGLS